LRLYTKVPFSFSVCDFPEVFFGVIAGKENGKRTTVEGFCTSRRIWREHLQDLCLCKPQLRPFSPCQPLKYEKDVPEVVLEELPELDCGWYLHNVLTNEECQQIIDVTEKMGYDLAKLTTVFGMVEDTSIRNNKRLMWQTDEGLFLEADQAE
jgi:hypothetical protein